MEKGLAIYTFLRLCIGKYSMKKMNFKIIHISIICKFFSKIIVYIHFLFRKSSTSKLG